MPITSSPFAAYRRRTSPTQGRVRWQLLRPKVQTFRSATRPRRSAQVKGVPIQSEALSEGVAPARAQSRGAAVSRLVDRMATTRNRAAAYLSGIAGRREHSRPRLTWRLELPIRCVPASGENQEGTDGPDRLGFMGLVLLAAVLPAGVEAQQFWQDSFDAYATGSPIAGQGGWETFDNNPAANAIVTNAPALSPPNALRISGPANVIRPFGTGAPTGDLYVKVFIPRPRPARSGSDPQYLLARWRRQLVRSTRHVRQRLHHARREPRPDRQHRGQRGAGHRVTRPFPPTNGSRSGWSQPAGLRIQLCRRPERQPLHAIPALGRHRSRCVQGSQSLLEQQQRHLRGRFPDLRVHTRRAHDLLGGIGRRRVRPPPIVRASPDPA